MDEVIFWKGNEYITHTDLDLDESAIHRIQTSQWLYIIPIFLIILLLVIEKWHEAVVLILAFLTLIYFSDLLFKMLLIIKTFTVKPEIKISQRRVNSLIQNWPTYTILCPLYKEWQVLEQFISAISQLDYPREKLQVLLLLEEDDTETIQAVNGMSLPNYFETIVIPHSLPKTKPKACNFGLKRAKGEYIVIYDAEDIPEKDQLKKAVLAFKKLPSEVICIQAKLNFYNSNQNTLTRLFTAEYSLWFDLILPGLQSIDAPIPLGGTSNHFKAKALKDLKGWDAFNVTEDCDLGIRLAKRGYKTAIIDSTTHEEANSELVNWFWQRTRWVKGYIQTYLVHTRKAESFIRSYGLIKFIEFNLLVGGSILSSFVNPFMWLITISYFLFRAHIGAMIESFFPAPIFYMGVTSLIIGNFVNIYSYMISSLKRNKPYIVKYAFIVPFYWIAMSGASWVAGYKLILQPFYWAKTKHGLHLKNPIEPSLSI